MPFEVYEVPCSDTGGKCEVRADVGQGQALGVTPCSVMIYANTSIVSIRSFPRRVPTVLPEYILTLMQGHTDFGSMTLLFRQPVAALQVRTHDEQWRWVKPYPGSITVNLADSLQFITNGFLKSSIHRVVAPPPDQAGIDRLGVLYFVRPEDDMPLKPVESAVLKKLGLEPENGMANDFTAGEWVKARVGDLTQVLFSRF